MEIQLFPNSPNEEAAAISQAQSLAQSALMAGIAAVFGSSFINLDPLTLFNFLNNLDIYVYTSLYYTDLDSSLVAFLQMLSPNSWLPNIFTYFINQNDGNQLDSAFSNFGNSTNLIMINSGPTLEILAVMIVIPFGLLLFRKTKFGWLNRQIAKLFEKYRYSAFLRFFLQSFLELSCNSAIGAYYTLFANMVQIFDFGLCLIITVIDIQTLQVLLLCLVIYLLQKRSEIARSKGPSESFLKAFGTLFEEFNSNAISSWLYYPLFLSKRLSILCLVLFVSDPVIQLILSIISSLFVSSI